MRDSLRTPGVAGIASDPDAAKSRVDSSDPGPPIVFVKPRFPSQLKLHKWGKVKGVLKVCSFLNL